MATPELFKSWKRTESYLRDARANLSPIAEAEFIDALAQFEHFLEHNELGFAFKMLTFVAGKSHKSESPQVFELLALAAANMGMRNRQRTLDRIVTKLRGRKYETSLPNEN